MNAKELYEQIWTRKLKTFSRLYQNDNFRIELFRRALTDKWVGAGRKYLLDIGCGNGYLMEMAEPMFEEVTGVDISGVAVESARKKGLRAFQVNIDTDSLPWPDGVFDCITCLDTIEHVMDPEHLIAEAARCLMPGGSLFIVTPNIMYHGWLRTLIEGNFPNTSGDTEMYNGGHLHHLTYYDLANSMSKFGLNPTRRSREPGAAPEPFMNLVRQYYKKGNEVLDFGDTVIIASGTRNA